MLSHLFVVAMVALMTSLGFWQLGRLDQRRGSNAAVEAALAADPVVVDPAVLADGSLADHARVVVTGSYLVGDEIEIANRSLDGRPGSWFATPLVVGGDAGRDAVVLVVRGFVPRSVIASGDLASVAPPPGTVTVEGLAFPSVGGGRVADGSAERPVLSRPDLDRAREVTGLDLATVWIRLEDQNPPQGSGLPVPVPREELSEGPHLSYAIQWFVFALGTVVVYGLILRRRLEGAAGDLGDTPHGSGGGRSGSPDDTAC